MTAQPIRVIFQGKDSGTFPNLESALTFVQTVCKNSEAPLDLVLKQSANETIMEIKSDPETFANKGEGVKTPIHVSAGLFDLSW